MKNTSLLFALFLSGCSYIDITDEAWHAGFTACMFNNGVRSHHWMPGRFSVTCQNGYRIQGKVEQ